MTDDVPAEEKARRAEAIMEIQRDISLQKNLDRMGTIESVLIDRFEGNAWYGRTSGDSPEVDNEVIIQNEAVHLRIGDFVDVRILDATEYDLYAQPV
jgi:ribosomal protein S12 methylthiotransferase